MKVINLFGGPGVGKSTLAAELFAMMKRKGHEVELVTEYAKYLVWADRVQMFSEQDYVFAKQKHKLHILKDKVEWAITDSPLLLSAIYAKRFNFVASFEQFVVDANNTFNNINVLLRRAHAYNPNGRNESEFEAREIDREISSYLISNHVPYFWVSAGDDVAQVIYEQVTTSPTLIVEK